MRIGGLELAPPFFSAPMAGITDRAFREILHEMGAGLVYTEMISDKALTYRNSRTFGMLDIDGEGPVAVQLCGSEPAVMAEAAKMVAERGAVLIDINMGCPAPKIVKNGEGSALLLQPERAEAIVRAVREAVSLPLTVKLRKGFSLGEETGLALAERCARAGADAVTLHGRVREEMYTGTADWDFIARAKAVLPVPVIGNGDITTAEQAMYRLRTSGCDAVMIGRGLLGNPWLLREAAALYAGQAQPPRPSRAEMLALAERHLRREVALCGEWTGVRQMRKHMAWYLRGFPRAARLRDAINHIEREAELLALLDGLCKGSEAPHEA